MDELIKNMTKSLRQYNSAANQAVIGINKSFVVVGYIIVSFFLLVEMMSWYKYLKQQGGELTYRLMLEVALKYLIAYFLVALSSQIVVAIMQVTSLLIRMVGANVSNDLFEFTALKKGNWVIRAVVNALAYLCGATALMLTNILVFLRFIVLYLYRAVSPLIVAFWMSDDTRSIATNLLRKTTAAALQGLLIVILLVIWHAFGVQTDIDLANADWIKTFASGFSYIGKCILFVWLLLGSQRMARSLLQAN